MSADKLASFRVDSQLWEQFQGYAKSQNSTATALLISYIKSVVNTGNVITSNPVVNTSSEVNNPSLSIQDIDNRIDNKIKSSIQGIDTLSIQDIYNCIDDSLEGGKIKEAISTSYAGMMGNFNGLLEELQDIKSQLQELQIPPAAAAAANDKLTIPNNTIENIRTTLKRKNKTVSAEQIRAAFKDAGWDGDNYQEIRKAVIDSLSGGEQS
ncbi:hypothetical protein [Dolichospermum sp. UHCC 0259]|uniref:hypothetical protein n=1 Tax=Dolichospermum sp. UHCC 0259 TaxID=2590010 RepID=UPI0014487305|nr:hypothetical protein [Dolichospermum sp. UHCC 0259]MTJ48389.1 hypothetical protein [Dolichospermum sp. UHCC 0259]